MLMRAAGVVVLLLMAGARQVPEAREALRLGRSQDEALYAAFTKGYSLAPSDPVDVAEIVTDFRRAVMIVRAHAMQGEFGFTERDLNVAMTPQLGLVSFIVEARLNIMHTYSAPPAYELYVSTGPDTPPLADRKLTRAPVYAIGPSAPLIGLRVEITVPRDKIDESPRPELILTDEHATVLWRARIDLSRFR